jgi:hypothetical protein
MKFSTRILSTGAFSAFMALGMTSVSSLAQAQAPQVSIQSEEAAHPRLVKAIHEMRHALEELKAAPDDFGGHKGQAIQDTERAIHSLKKALYFRMKLDDAALDRIDG